MNYKKIELDKWDRKEYFNIYTKDIPLLINRSIIIFDGINIYFIKIRKN